MCDQTEVAYLPNDIVWVKLSNVWWPAEVQDESKLDEDVTGGLKKKPLAIVKFFDEDLYEYPKNLNQIYRYNCLRKDEFIKKGLDLWRAELSRDIPYNMKKFPQDVQVAEEKTGGNPNYIDDPKFLPEEKFDYREKFGLKPLKKIKEPGRSLTPLPKQPRKTSTPSPKVTFSTPLSVPSTSRALGSERKTPNSAKKSRSLSTPPSILKDPLKHRNKEELICSYFPCVFCNYSCKRISNAIYHIRAHLRGLILPPPNVIPTKYESVFEENQKKRAKKILSPEPVVRVQAEKVPQKRKSSPELSASSKKKKHDNVPKKDKSMASPSIPPVSNDTAVSVGPVNTTPKKRAKKQKVITKEKKIESTALEILKDWDDESNVDDHEMDVIPANEESSIADKSTDSLAQSVQSDSNNQDGSENLIESPSSPQTLSDSIKTPEKSCFDFEDTDESLNLDQSLKFGQKLPRVINDKQSTTSRFKHEIKADTIEDDLSKEVESFLEEDRVPVLPEMPSATAPASTTGELKQDLKPEATEDELAKSVEDFLETANVPDLPEVPPCITVPDSEVETQVEKKEEAFHIKSKMETYEDIEKDKSLQAEEITETQPLDKIIDQFSLIEKSSYKDIKKREDTNDQIEREISDKIADVDAEGSHDVIDNEELSSCTLEKNEGNHPVETTPVTYSSENDSLDNKPTVGSITSTIAEVSTMKGKFDEKPLNFDLSEDYLKSKTISEISEVEVDKKSNKIKSDMPLLFCDAIKEDKVFFPDNECQTFPESIQQAAKEDNVLSDNNSILESTEENIETSTEQISLEVMTTELEKVEVKSTNQLKFEDKNGAPLRDESIISVKNDIPKELSKDVLKDSENHGVLKLDHYTSQPEVKIDDEKQKNNKDVFKSLTPTEKKVEVTEKKNVETASNILSSQKSDNIPTKKPVSLSSESSLFEVKLEEPSNQIESKLQFVDKKESAGVVRKHLGNDNRHSKKRKLENDTIISKDISKKDKSATIVEIKELQEETISVLTPEIAHEIDIADIPLPVDEYPMKAESFQNKTPNQVTKLVVEEPSDLKEECQPNVPGISEEKESQNQIISPDQVPLDINSMPVVFASDVPKPLVEYIFGKNIPRHPNADIIHIRLVPKGQEKYVKLRPGERIRKKVTIIPDPNYKPCHNLKRIPFPTYNKEPEPLPSKSETPSAGESSQGPSTSFAVPAKPVGNNVISMKPGLSTVNISGKIPIKSANVRLLHSGQKVLVVPSTTMKLAVASTQSTITTGRLLKPKTAEKVQKKTKQIIVSKANVPTVTKNIPMNKNVSGTVKGVSPSLVSVKNQSSRVVPASKVPNPGQRSTAILMKPPNAPAPKILKASSAMKGSNTIFVQHSSAAIGQRTLPNTSSASGSLDRKAMVPKLKQSSPNILQKSPKKLTRQVPGNSTQQIAATSSQPQSSEIVTVSNLPAIVQSETPQTAGEQVVLVTLDQHGNCIPANHILPIETNENRSLLDSASLINIDSTNTSGSIDNFVITNYIKIGSSSSSSSLKKPGTQDILAEALANTQVLQTDPSELSEDNSVYSQYPTTSLASSVLETTLTLNQPPIMSPLEVPSSINTQALQIKGKNSDINPSMPLLTDDILSDSSSSRHTSHLTFQLVQDDQIVVTSSGDVLTDSDNQIMFSSEMLSGQEESTEVHSADRVAKEDNILPEFLRGDFNKKSQKTKRCYPSNNDDR